MKFVFELFLEAFLASETFGKIFGKGFFGCWCLSREPVCSFEDLIVNVGDRVFFEFDSSELTVDAQATTGVGYTVTATGTTSTTTVSTPSSTPTSSAY